MTNDPDYAPAYVGLGWTWFDEWPFGWSEDRTVPFKDPAVRIQFIDTLKKAAFC